MRGCSTAFKSQLSLRGSEQLGKFPSWSRTLPTDLWSTAQILASSLSDRFGHSLSASSTERLEGGIQLAESASSGGTGAHPQLRTRLMRRCWLTPTVENQQLSDRELARICAVGAPLVGSIRANCNPITVGQPRIGADGKARRIPDSKKSEPQTEGWAAAVIRPTANNDDRQRSTKGHSPGFLGKFGEAGYGFYTARAGVRPPIPARVFAPARFPKSPRSLSARTGISP